MKQVIDHKLVNMTSEEWDYYQRLVVEFTVGTNHGKEQFRDLFDVDTDGNITFIHPPIRKQIGWGILFFIQNLMINQQLRKFDKQLQDWFMKNGKSNG